MIRRFLLWSLLAAVVGLGLYFFICNMAYSRGSRSGSLIKLSYKGVIMKTYEGQLNLGGFQQYDDSGIAGNIWDFSVLDKEVYEQLESLEGKRVRLEYHQKFKAMPWQGKTNYFVSEVEEIE